MTILPKCRQCRGAFYADLDMGSILSICCPDCAEQCMDHWVAFQIAGYEHRDVQFICRAPEYVESIR